ncbi:MAG: DUF3631 domain-containing protein [Gammaproteobacteria bacterium]
MLRDIGRMFATWARDNRAKLRAHEPTVPAGAFGRRRDKWVPLFVLVELAGGHGPARCKNAYLAEEYTARSKPSMPQSESHRTLGEIGDKDAPVVHYKACAHFALHLPKDIAGKRRKQEPADLVLDRGNSLAQKPLVVALKLIAPEADEPRISYLLQRPPSILGIREGAARCR